MQRFDDHIIKSFRINKYTNIFINIKPYQNITIIFISKYFKKFN